MRRPLPTYLYTTSTSSSGSSTTYFRYRRPDTKQFIGLGSDGGFSLGAARALNALFDVDSTLASNPRPGPAVWRANAERYLATNDFPVEFASLIPDLIPQAPGEDAEPAPTKPKRRRRRLPEGIIDPDEPPLWVIDLHNQSAGEARRRDMAFDLSVADVCALVNRAKGACEVTGVEFSDEQTQAPEKQLTTPWRPVVDRVDRDAGYSRDNCRLVCVAARRATSVLGEEILLTMARSYAKKRPRR